MEIKIESKKNNPVLNRTEVHFTVKHEGQNTPNKDIIRTELADILNAKKENIIINNINSSFGTAESTGYAKVYTSLKQIKNTERKHFLKRNKLIKEEKNDDKGKEEKIKAPEPKPDETKDEPKEEPKDETVTETKEETEKDTPAPTEEKPAEETTPEKPEEKPPEPKPEEPTQDKQEEKKIIPY